MSSSHGKLLMCVPKFSPQRGRVKTVGQAVVKIAEMLGADIEVSQRENVLSVWVYYKNHGKEVPLYFDWGKDWDEDDVLRAISHSLDGLSLCPERAMLQTCDKEVKVD